MTQHKITQRRARGVIFCPRALDNIANLHIGRAGDFTTFAVDAIFQRLVIQCAIFQTQTLAIRPGLFWPWITGIHPAHRAGGGADGALNAVFEAGVVHCWPPARWAIC
ncbi:Uncharacterised protein [Shigella sonnei]|nr:Uncharacterised protein [Shigella sonnei]CSP63508.1 Uncharacterised protein [Shigella sonnei]